MIYFFFAAYFFCGIFSLVETNKNSQDKLLKLSFIIIVFILLCFFIFLKPMGVGFDDHNYYYVVNSQCESLDCNTFNPYNWEKGFIILVEIASYFDDVQFNILVILVFTISYTLYSFSFYKLSPIISISLLWYLSHYFFYKDLTQFRSAIAYSIVLVGFYYLYKNRLKMFFFSIFCACFFHISAIIGVLSFFAVKIGLNKLFYLIFIALFISATGILNPLYDIVFKVFLHEGAYNTYILDSNGFAKSLGTFNPTTLKYIVIAIFFYLIRNRLSYIPTFEFVLSIYMIAPIWILVFSDFGTLAGRPASIFSVLEGVLFSHLIYSYKDKSIMIRISILLLSILLLIINLLIVNPINTHYLI
ncbi:EpsG family protein [Photobacterium kishitanii]|uniref:EpsG family protein n=1 Tax=Photobacterium kishitanii TaxID=318456 RepID=UPI000432747B|nr:EpsG family protein [Photobacterium kishitanii]CEO38471.1 membrane hypothetical protein [Photobacterium kishitanii]